MRVWLVTGTSSGLGQGLTQAIADHGDEVVVTTRDGSSGVRLDVTDADSIAAAVAVAHERFGRIDVLDNTPATGCWARSRS
jgi:NAD(P)-dependent dehydrogenase (short-subunit alcohol dehydrogenase family)